MSASFLGVEIRQLGTEPLVHFTCKDKNRNELESLLYGLERASVRNRLVMTGDAPKSGYLGRPKPVFDLDPVTLRVKPRMPSSYPEWAKLSFCQSFCLAFSFAFGCNFSDVDRILIVFSIHLQKSNLFFR